MAIKPEDCLKLTQDEQDDLEILEAEIDDFLRENFQSKGSKISFKLKRVLNTRILNKIKEIYTAAGWQINQVVHPLTSTSELEFLEKSPQIYNLGSCYDR